MPDMLSANAAHLLNNLSLTAARTSNFDHEMYVGENDPGAKELHERGFVRECNSYGTVVCLTSAGFTHYRLLLYVREHGTAKGFA